MNAECLQRWARSLQIVSKVSRDHAAVASMVRPADPIVGDLVSLLLEIAASIDEVAGNLGEEGKPS